MTPGLIIEQPSERLASHDFDGVKTMRSRYLSAFARGTTLMLMLTVTMSPMSRGQVGPASEKIKGITPARAKTEVDQIARDLGDARKLATKIGDRAIRERMELILSRAELRARDHSNELARARPPQTEPPAPVVLSPADFDKLLSGLKKEAFDGGKLTYVENFASKRPLTCEQTASILKCFAFDKDRVNAVKLLYPVIVDRHNFNDVLNAFAFETGKADARKAVGLK
jgi:hypothetical protein